MEIYVYYLRSQKKFTDVINLRNSTWRDYLNVWMSPNVITIVLPKGREEGQSQNIEMFNVIFDVIFSVFTR